MRMLSISHFSETPRYIAHLSSESLGSGYLTSMLQRHGGEVHSSAAKRVKASAAITPHNAQSNTHQLVVNVVDEALQVAQKQQSPDVLVTAGGYFHPSRHKEIVEASSTVDPFIRDDVENAL
jgi:hypothetical protein